MAFRVQLYTRKQHDLWDGCRLAVRHRLFRRIAGGGLYSSYCTLKREQSLRKCLKPLGYNLRHMRGDYTILIGIVFDDDVPIASCTVAANYCFMVFVKRAYRRRGVATLLFNAVKAACPQGTTFYGFGKQTGRIADAMFQRLGIRDMDTVARPKPNQGDTNDVAIYNPSAVA